MNGKGDKQRPTDRKRFSDNYDKIFKRDIMLTVADVREIEAKMPPEKIWHEIDRERLMLEQGRYVPVRKQVKKQKHN